MTKADIHAIFTKGNEKYHKQFLSCIDKEDINFYGIENSGNQPLDKFRGLQLGSNPYVGYVDDDDFFQEGLFTILADALDKNPDKIAVFSANKLVDEEGRMLGFNSYYKRRWNFKTTLAFPGYPYNAILFRRSAVEEVAAHMLEVQTYPEVVLKGLIATLGDYLHVPEAVYYWRRHENQYSKKTRGIEVAKKYVEDVAYLCSKCRVRLGMEPTPFVELKGRKCCGQL